MAEIAVDRETGVCLPWWFEREVVEVWNGLMSRPPLKFRTFQHKRNQFDSRRRVSELIVANAALLGGSRKTNPNVLHGRFSYVLHGALTYVRNSWNEDEDALEVLGAKYPITMGFWQFTRPNLQNLVYLDGLNRGEPDALAALEADRLRRTEKAKIIRAFQANVDEFIQKCSYVTGSHEDSNKRLRDTFDIAIAEGLVAAEEALEWTEG